MKKTAILLIIVMMISLIPALNVSAADEYYLKGVYDGAYVVVQQEPTKTVTVVDAGKANMLLDTASNVDKVVFTFNGVEIVDTESPYAYTMEFTYCGTQTLKYDVYKQGGSTDTPYESKTITFTTIGGSENAVSFTENFSGPFQDTNALAKAIVGNEGANYQKSYLTLATADFNNSKALTLDANSRTASIQFRGAAPDTGCKVHYYEFDIAVDSLNRHWIYARADANYSGGGYTQTLVDTRSHTTDGTTPLFTANVYRRLRIVFDYNETPTASIYVDGKEYKRFSLESVVSGPNPSLVMDINTSGVVYIDNFKYSVYDAKTPQSFVGASIQGGNDRPVLETLSDIRITGTEYWEGQDLTGCVSISERPNGSEGDFTASSINFTSYIDNTDVVIDFPDNQVLTTGTTYKINISNVKDNYFLNYNDYSFVFRTLNEGENPLPEISLTSPVAGERYYPDESTITLSADAYDTLGGSIAKVEFFADGALVGEGVLTEGNEESGTYTFDWVLDDSIDQSEPVAITAKATDNSGDITETSPVNVVIWSRQLPEITIMNPAEGTLYCSNLAGVDKEVKPTIEFATADADGTIETIEVRVDGEIDGTVTDPVTATSYTLLSVLEPGDHTIIVEAYDDDGQSSRDSISVKVEELGKAGYILREEYKTEDLLSRWTLSGEVEIGHKDKRNQDYTVVIKSNGEKSGEAYQFIVHNFTEKSFVADIKMAFSDTSAKRTIKLGDTEIATFDRTGEITYGGVAKATYLPGEVYSISAVIDAEDDKVYALVNGAQIGSAEKTFAINTKLTISHDGVAETVSETDIIAVSMSTLGAAVKPTVKVDGTVLSDVETVEVDAANGSRITVAFENAADLATLDGNVSMINAETGKAVNLTYANGVFTINEMLKYASQYQIIVLPDVRDVNGSGYSGTYIVSFKTEEPETVGIADVTATAPTWAAGNFTATLEVEFNGADESKTVYLVCAAYNGAKMEDYQVIELTAPATASDIAVALSGISESSVIEAFVVDSMDDLNSISDKIIVIE